MTFILCVAITFLLIGFIVNISVLRCVSILPVTMVQFRLKVSCFCNCSSLMPRFLEVNLICSAPKIMQYFSILHRSPILGPSGKSPSTTFLVSNDMTCFGRKDSEHGYLSSSNTKGLPSPVMN